MSVEQVKAFFQKKVVRIALAAVLITDRANEPVSAEKADEALTVLKGCGRVLCTCSFGSVNRENRRLLEYAQAHGLLCGIEDIG